MANWKVRKKKGGREETRRELKNKKIILDKMLTTQKPLKERTSAWWKCHKENLQTSWGNRIHSKALHYIFHKELLKIHIDTEAHRHKYQETW